MVFDLGINTKRLADRLRQIAAGLEDKSLVPRTHRETATVRADVEEHEIKLVFWAKIPE